MQKMFIKEAVARVNFKQTAFNYNARPNYFAICLQQYPKYCSFWSHTRNNISYRKLFPRMRKYFIKQHLIQNNCKFNLLVMLVNSIALFLVPRALFGKPRKWVPIWYCPREQWRIKRLWDISAEWQLLVRPGRYEIQ